MMKRFGLYTFLLAAVFMVACNKKQEVQLEQDFALKYKHTATLGHDLEIKFNELSDSRCASDVECIIPGDLKIGLRINKENFEFLLGSVNHSKATKDGFEIELKDATPLSFTSTERPRKKDYTVYLVVRKAQQ